MDYKQFEHDFNEKYQSSIDAFIDDLSSGKTTFDNMKLIYNEDDVYYDSYGNEDTTLIKIFYFEDYNCHVRFLGNRSSYNGEEWNYMEEVKPKTETITTYETIK